MKSAIIYFEDVSLSEEEKDDYFMLKQALETEDGRSALRYILEIKDLESSDYRYKEALKYLDLVDSGIEYDVEEVAERFLFLMLNKKYEKIEILSLKM